MNAPLDDIDRIVGEALAAEADGIVADDDLLARIKADLEPSPLARPRRRARWLAAAAVLTAVGLGGAELVGDDDSGEIVVDLAEEAESTSLLLPTALPPGYRLVEADRAPAGGTIADPVAYRRAHFVGTGPDPDVVFADWLRAPSSLVREDEPVEESIPFAGGRAVVMPRRDDGVDQRHVRWTGEQLSGWLLSSDVPPERLVEMARTFVDEGEVRPPDGFEVVESYLEHAATRLVYERGGPADRQLPTVSLTTYPVPLDVEGHRRLAEATGDPAHQVDVHGRVGLVGEGEVLWSPSPGVTASVSGELSEAELVSVARSVRRVPEERWREAASEAARGEPEAYAWRTLHAGETSDGGSWVLARRHPVDPPGCYSLYVLERQSTGPVCDDAPQEVDALLAARVPVGAARAELVVEGDVVPAEVHRLDDAWSVAVADLGPDHERFGSLADLTEVRAYDATGAEIDW